MYTRVQQCDVGSALQVALLAHFGGEQEKEGVVAKPRGDD
jgi:hypothetical protein